MAGKVNPPQAESKLSARITVVCLSSVKFQLCCSSSPPQTPCIFFSPSSLIRGENLPTGSLSFHPSLLLASSHLLLQQFCQVYLPTHRKKVCSSSPTRCGGNDNKRRRKIYRSFKTCIFKLTSWQTLFFWGGFMALGQLQTAFFDDMNFSTCKCKVLARMNKCLRLRTITVTIIHKQKGMIYKSISIYRYYEVETRFLQSI